MNQFIQTFNDFPPKNLQDLVLNEVLDLVQFLDLVQVPDLAQVLDTVWGLAGRAGGSASPRWNLHF